MRVRIILTSLILAAFAFLTVFFGWLDVIDNSAEDLLYHRASGTSPEIKIISIDDRSLSALGSYGEWDRELYAKLVETLCVSDDIKPAVIGFDVLFEGYKNKTTDLEFAEACKKHGRRRNTSAMRGSPAMRCTLF